MGMGCQLRPCLIFQSSILLSFLAGRVVQSSMPSSFLAGRDVQSSILLSSLAVRDDEMATSHESAHQKSPAVMVDPTEERAKEGGAPGIAAVRDDKMAISQESVHQKSPAVMVVPTQEQAKAGGAPGIGMGCQLRPSLILSNHEGRRCPGHWDGMPAQCPGRLLQNMGENSVLLY